MCATPTNFLARLWLVCLCLIGFYSISNAQEFRQKHWITAHVASQEFFDGSSLLTGSKHFSVGRLNLGIGLGYRQQIAGPHSVGAKVMFTSSNYYDEVRSGAVTERSTLVMDFVYRHRLINRDGRCWEAFIGPSLRIGQEWILLRASPWETLGLIYDLKDFGLTAGTGLAIGFARRFVFTPELDFTTFLYRGALISHKWALFPKDSPSVNILQLQLGIGFRF